MSSAAQVHPSAVIEGVVRLGEGVVVGPGCVLTAPRVDGEEREIEIGAGTRLIANVVVHGPVTIGAGCTLFPGVCVGFGAQDYKVTEKSPTGGVRIGDGCLLREHATVHSATAGDRVTTIDARCFLMVNAHVGHDAVLGRDVVMVNNSAIAGHCVVGDKVNFGGGSALQQGTRVGRLAFVSGGVMCSTDIPPFCTANERNRLGGVNLVGLRRSGMDRGDITRVREAFRRALRPSLPRDEQVAVLEEIGASSAAVAEMAAFVREAKRAVCPGPGRPPRMFGYLLHRLRRGEGVELGSED